MSEPTVSDIQEQIQAQRDRLTQIDVEIDAFSEQSAQALLANRSTKKIDAQIEGLQQERERIERIIPKLEAQIPVAEKRKTVAQIETYLKKRDELAAEIRILNEEIQPLRDKLKPLEKRLEEVTEEHHRYGRRIGDYRAILRKDHDMTDDDITELIDGLKAKEA